MSLLIAEQLSGLYQELTESKPFSEVVGVDLSRASSRGRLLHLIIAQCWTEDEPDPLFLTGIVDRWFVCDARGFRPDENPLEGTGAYTVTEEWASLHPLVRFATAGGWVRFGMQLGHQWYMKRQGPLGPDGRFIVSELTDYLRQWLPP